MIKKKIDVDNKRVIEYYTNNVDSSKIPIIYSPGVWEPAFRGVPLLEGVKDRLCISISYRGRGDSTSPDPGYDWYHHSDDLSVIINELEIDNAIFVCFSKGVSYTLGY